MTYFATGANVGGGVVPLIPNRRDHSVNGAWADGFQNLAGPTGPILRSQTNTNPGGGYNGGGTGNKAILGHFLPSPLPLGSLLSLEWTISRLQPEGATGPGIQLPYMNLVVDLGAPIPPPPTPPPALPGPLVLLVLGDAGNPLPLGVYSAPSPTQLKATWSAATERVLVVFGKGMVGFPNPPGPVVVASPEGPQLGPNGNTPLGNWQNYSYTIAAILAAYPGAQIVNADPVDGGMPAATILSGALLVAGDSANHRQSAVRVDSWALNGVQI